MRHLFVALLTIIGIVGLTAQVPPYVLPPFSGIISATPPAANSSIQAHCPGYSTADVAVESGLTGTVGVQTAADNSGAPGTWIDPLAAVTWTPGSPTNGAYSETLSTFPGHFTVWFGSQSWIQAYGITATSGGSFVQITCTSATARMPAGVLGGVASVTAGSSGNLVITPTTGSVVADTNDFFIYTGASPSPTPPGPGYYFGPPNALPTSPGFWAVNEGSGRFDLFDTHNTDSMPILEALTAGHVYLGNSGGYAVDIGDTSSSKNVALYGGTLNVHSPTVVFLTLGTNHPMCTGSGGTLQACTGDQHTYTYTAAGTAEPSTYHCLDDTITASGATTTINLVGSAAFSTAAYDLFIWDTTISTMPVLTAPQTSTSFTWTNVGTDVYAFHACGS